MNKNKNFKTVDTLLKQTNKINLFGGVAECIKFENRSFFSKINLKNKNVIEFGCGTFPASFGIENENMPNIYVACDVSQKLINVAKRVDSRPDYKVLDLEKKIASKHKNKFNVVILKGVLHHVKFPALVLKKVSRTLKKDGVIIVSEPNLSSVIGNLAKWFLSFFFKISMEDSPYGQLRQVKIKQSIRKSNMRIINEWYTSLIAFPLTGDYGRKPIIPDNRSLFKLLIFLEKIFSFVLNKFIFFAKISHFKVNFIIKKN